MISLSSLELKVITVFLPPLSDSVIVTSPVEESVSLVVLFCSIPFPSLMTVVNDVLTESTLPDSLKIVSITL